MDNQPSFATQQLVAALVDRYLQDNSFLKTHTCFRNEASFILNSPMIHDELFVNLLSLDKMMDDLIWLNDEKVMMLNERVRTQKLLKSIKWVLKSYCNSVNGKLPQTKLPEPPIPPSQPNANSAVLPTGVTTFTTTPAGLLVPKSINTDAGTGNGSTRVMADQERLIMERERYQTRLLLFRMQHLINNYIGFTTITTTPAISLMPQSINTNATTGNISTPVMSESNGKRKDTEAMDAPSIGKKPRGKPCIWKIHVQDQNTLPQSNNVVNKQTVSQPSSETQSIARNVVPSGSQVQNSSDGKCLFNPSAVSIPINLLVPMTPTPNFLRVPPCNGEATPNLSRSIIVRPPTGIESLPITNALVPPLLQNAKSSVVPQPKLGNRTPTGVTTISTPPAKFSVPQSINTNATNGIVSTPLMSVSNRMDAPSIEKKPRGKPGSWKIHVQDHSALPQSNNAVTEKIVSQSSSATQSLAGNFVPSVSQLQESSSVKCLFNPLPVSIPVHSPVPKTPTRTTSCQRDASVIETTPNLIKKDIVNPPEQVDYIKSRHCISPVKTDSEKGSKKDHVRSKSGFDASDMYESLDKPLPKEISTYESNKQNDLPMVANFTFDDDLEAIISLNGNDLGTNFSCLRVDDALAIFDDVLNDPDLPNGGVDFSDYPTSNHLKDNPSRSSHECKGEQVISELPSTVARVLSKKDVNIQDPDSLAPMESFKKSTTNLKSNRQLSFGKENC